MNVENQNQRAARLVPDEPLPPYSYVTGRFPHPTRDPAGHSFGHVPQPLAALDAENWRQSRAYLFGCDLFNQGYYWEAHETWEGLWHACGRRGATADFVKGLIKLAAAGVKAREGRPAGVMRHAERACELFRSVSGQLGGERDFLGLSLGHLIETGRRLACEGVVCEPSNEPVKVVFDFALLPAP